MVRSLRDTGVTIILTTHYIEEAEQMADRIGVINKGEIILVEDKAVLMEKLGKKELILKLQRPLARIPQELSHYHLELSERRDPTQVHLPCRGRAAEDREPLARDRRARDRFQRSADSRELARRHLRQPGEHAFMNRHAIRAIYLFEMARTFRTLLQSIAAPVVSTSLYFVVFGSAIGPRIAEIEGVRYAAFIIPGLVMLSLLNESISNASFGIYMPRFAGTIYEVLSAPISFKEIIAGYVGAAATKSILLGAIILITARLFVPYHDRSSALDGPLPRVDCGHLQPFWIRHRHLGRRIRKAAARADADRDPVDVSRRQLLLDQDAPDRLAADCLVQPRRLPGQRLSLELLRGVGCRAWRSASE